MAAVCFLGLRISRVPQIDEEQDLYMLKEDQAAELLRRCERIVGHELLQTRGNLRSATSRAAALLELLMIEALSDIGTIEYEPLSGSSPDIRLLTVGRPLWIEIAYLYPRFWQQERQSEHVMHWLHKETMRRGIPPWKIIPEFHGDQNSKAGPVRKLPHLNERKKFLNEPEIAKFYQDIVANPEVPHTCSPSDYTISISYVPNAHGPHTSSSGLAQESPRTVKEHAVFRVLREKAGQHNVLGPRIVCVGSDQSPALSSFAGPGRPALSDAVGAAFYQYRSLSGALIVSIDDSCPTFALPFRQAKGHLFLNPYAKNPMTQAESQLLCGMNLNRWEYSFALRKWEYPNNRWCRRVAGTLACSPRGIGVEIEVPANIVIDALAGKTTLAKEYMLDGRDEVSLALEEGWVIEACSLKAGNIEAGEPPKVVLRLVPPKAVFWPKQKCKKQEP